MPSETRRRPPRFALVLALDALACALALLAAQIEYATGFSTRIAGVRISANDVTRPILACILVVALRLVISRVGLFGVSIARLRACRVDADALAGPTVTWRQLVWPTVGLCAFGTALLWPQLRHMDSVPDLGDPLFSMWRTGWLFHFLQGDPRPLFSPNIFYPQPLTLTYSDAMLWPSLTAVPLLAAGMHPVVAYNVLFLSSFVLSGLAMFALAANLTGSRTAAFIAALLFGFYPYRFQHYSHLELQMTYWMPLALLACHRFFATQRARYAVAAALCLIGQLYSSMYYGVFFALYMIPVLGMLLLMTRLPLRRMWPGAVAACAIGLVLSIPLARPYLAARQARGERGEVETLYYSATGSDYLQAHGRSYMYGRYLPAKHPERELFPGVLAPALAAGALVPPIGAAEIVYGVGLLFAFDGSLGLNGLIYPHLYSWFGVARGIRAPARFAVIVGMTLALLAAFTVRRVLARCRTEASRTLVFAALIAAIGLDLWPVLKLQPVWDQPPAIYSAVARSPDAVLAEFPIRAHMGLSAEGLPYMYFSLWHWTNMINGYSGFFPLTYDALLKRVEPFPDPKAIEGLAAQGVTHVSVNCALYSTARGCAGVLEGADRSPRLRLVVETRWQGAVVRLYQLVKRAAGSRQLPAAS